MKLIDLVQGSESWLKFRQENIGASDAPIIAGCSPYKTKYQLWLEKMGMFKQKHNGAMQKGTDLEPIARSLFNDTYGGDYSPAVVKHNSIDYLSASLDGLSKDLKSILEIKYSSQSDHESAKNGKIPTKYIAQLQHQMEVCEKDELNYFSFNGSEGVLVKVKRDDQYIEKLLLLKADFWEMVQSFTAPDLSHKDFIERNDNEWMRTAEDYIQACLTRKEFEKKEAGLKARLIELSNDQNTIGGGVKIIKIAKKGSISYSEIPEIKNLDLEKYRKEPVEYWRIFLKEKHGIIN